MTVALVGVVMSGLIIGSVSSVVDASRRDYNRYYQDRYDRGNNESRNNRNDDRKEENAQPVSPQNRQTTVTPPKQAVVQPQPVVTPPQPVITQQQPVAVVTPVTPTPPPVDTAPQAQITASNQAINIATTPVTYTSEKISTELRDRLLIMGAVIGMSGAVIYMFSFITPLPPRPVLSTRRIIPVMEG